MLTMFCVRDCTSIRKYNGDQDCHAMVIIGKWSVPHSTSVSSLASHSFSPLNTRGKGN